MFCPFFAKTDGLNAKNDGSCTKTDAFLVPPKLFGAAFSGVQFLSYGPNKASWIKYLDNICQAAGHGPFSSFHGADMCVPGRGGVTAASKFAVWPGECGQGWTGNKCGGGCEGENPGAFRCHVAPVPDNRPMLTPVTMHPVPPPRAPQATPLGAQAKQQQQHQQVPPPPPKPTPPPPPPDKGEDPYELQSKIKPLFS